MKTNKTQVEYTAYETEYHVCLPMNLEIIIPSDEPVRLLSAVTEELDYSRLTATYSRSERIEHSPRLLFKIVLYGCTRGIYATREIECACRENVNFMYLLEGHRAPDHNTWDPHEVAYFVGKGETNGVVELSRLHGSERYAVCLDVRQAAVAGVTSSRDPFHEL